MPKKPDPFIVLAMSVRQALLAMVDAIEVYFGMPRTSEMRKELKRLKGKL